MNPRLPDIHLRLAVVYALAATSTGLAMAMSQDHRLAVAHAHLNLVGWVSIAVYGVFLRLWPAAAAGKLAAIQALLAHVGVVVMTTGLAGLPFGLPFAPPLAAAGSILVLAGMGLFAVLVFSATRIRTA